MGTSKPVVRNRIRELRKRMNLTQEELAKLVEEDVSTVAKHEKSVRNLSAVQVDRYAAVLKVPVAEIFRAPESAGSGRKR